MDLHYLFRSKVKELVRMYSLCLLMVLSLVLTSFYSAAQVVLSLDHQVKAGMPASTPSGDYWTMQLDYSISSITGYANGVKIEVALPDYVDAASGLVGTSHAPISNFVFTNTPGAKKITITFVDPVPSGSNGVIEYRIRAQNGTTPNGTIIEPCATMTDGSGATSGSKCDEMPITAVNKFCGTKLLFNIGAIGGEVTYRVYLSASRSYPQYGSVGSLNASNISITDYYPVGSTLVSAKVFSSNDVEIPTTITHGTNSVTTTIPDYIHNSANLINSAYFEVTVLYTEPPFNTTDPVTNKASITYTPLGQSPITIDENSGANGAFCTNDLIETHILPNEVVSAELKKTVSYDSTVYAGGNIIYVVTFKNTGSVPLENVVIVENIPDELTLVSNRIDARGLGQVTAVEYQTNLSTTWLPLAAGSSPNTGGAKITKVRLTLVSPFNGGEVLAGINNFTFRTDANISDTTDIENCLTWTSTTAGLVTDPVCNTTGTILPPATTAKAVYSSTHSPGCGNNFPIGTELTLAGTIRAEIGYADMENPVAAFFVPKGFEYIAGSELFNPMTSGVTGTPVFTIVPDFMQKDGIFYDMYKWTFPAGTTIPMSLQMGVSFKVKITNQVPSGIGQTLLFVADGSNVSVKNSTDLNGYMYTDTNDWDGDGNTTEQFRVASTNYTSCPLIVAASASMESIKWVKGLLDEDYSRYPAFGKTVPGGNADYKLIVSNKGNVPMKDIKIIDILPYVGDRGVIDPQARLTEWRPNLAAPISAPAGIIVSYSVEKNPCRDELRQPGDPLPFPAGCVAAGWSTTPPADITRVQSVKIDFGSTVLGVGDSLIFAWPMRAPVTAPTDGEIAWNSFGFVATRTDNNQPLIAAEPIKVGIQVITGLPAYYGDRVWYDDNRNGLQDAGEAGVDGVTVHLYSPAAAGVQNPAVDSLVNFTITGNGGLYKFSNLTPGEYYAVFFLPSGFSISPDNQGTNDAIDSDGIPGTLDGQTVTIVPITTLEEEEEDYTWDQGIYCLLTPTVSPIQTMAVNGSVTLTATGGTSYLWTGPNGFTASTASITINPVTPADTGTYTVTVMDGECRASLSTGIEIEDCPVIAAPETTPQAVCAGESVVLSGTCVSPATIKWYSDEALTTELSSTTVNPTVTTTYYAVCENAECVSASSTEMVVTVNEIPTITISGTATCAADGLRYSVTVTATAGATITSSAGTVTGNTISGIPSGVSAIITAELEGCRDSVTVMQNCTIPCVAPNPTVRGAATICEGESTELTVEGCTTGFTYLWSTGAVTQSITVEPASTTTYTVRCVSTTEATCISVTPGSAEVTVTPKVAAPTGVTATPSEIYTGESSVLTATCAAGLTPSWFTDEALTTPLVSTTVSPVTTSTYYVICGEDKDCAEIAEITVTVTDAPCVAPNPTVRGAATICEGESTELTAEGCTTGFTYLWSTGAVTQSITVEPASTTTYTVRCVSTTEVTCISVTPGSAEVTVTPKVAAPTGVTATPSEIYTGESSVLTATCAAGLTPSWFTDEALTTPLTSTTVSPLTTTTYYIICGEDKDCAEVAEITVTVTDEPLVFDLALRKRLGTGQSRTVQPGDEVMFTITVFNQGNVAAQNIQVTDYIPDGLTLVAGTVWTAASGMATLNTPIASLAGGDSTKVNITFTVNAGVTGPVINLAEISSVENEEGLEDIDSTPDDDKDNDGEPKDDVINEDGKNNDGEDEDDHDPETITVTPTPIFDLALRKTMAPGSKTIYKVGDVVTFNITVFNQGTVAATSVDLVDYIPAGLTLQDANWTLDGDKARWNGAITNLAPETQRTVTISFVVNSNASGIVINTAEISGSENEEGLEDKDSTPDDDKDNDGPVKNDEIDEDGKDGRDEDDHDIEPITICPDAKCLNVKTVRNK